MLYSTKAAWTKHVFQFLMFSESFKSRSRIFKQRSWHLGKSWILPFVTPKRSTEEGLGPKRLLYI